MKKMRMRGGDLYCTVVVRSPDSNAEVPGSIPKLGRMALFFATSGGSIFLGLGSKNRLRKLKICLTDYTLTRVNEKNAISCSTEG